MAALMFKPWEKWLTNLKLRPKLILLIVVSLLLLIGKQLWNVELFYQSVIVNQQDKVQQLAQSNAQTLTALMAIENQDFTLAEQALAATVANNGVYVIDYSNDKKLAQSKLNQIINLKQPLQSGQTLSSLIKTNQTQQPFALQDEQGYGYIVKLPSLNLAVISYQSNAQALNHYQQYLIQIVWQTALITVIFIVILLLVSRIMLRQIGCLKQSIQALANNDLSQPMLMDCRDEFGELSRELEQGRCQLTAVFVAQRQAATTLSQAAETMSLMMEQTKESAQEEFAEIDQLASAMAEMTSTVQTVAGHARDASNATLDTSEQAAQGQKFVSRTMVTINQLSNDITQSAAAVNQVETRVDKISSVIVTIQSISEQTNLLALNAAIEAARAGDAGRGFAVVADEVRNLAQRTQTATVEIQDMIAQLQQSAQQAVTLMERSVVEATEGVDLVTSAGDELNKIVEQIQQINDMNFQIAAAAEQQSTVADEMNMNLTNVRELVDGSVGVVTELTQTAVEMHQQASDLEAKIDTFKV
ncbi:methyl-accepting chemotaxis protein [Photobacterium kishitanii]|uniref:methyl-accepting chemotaxis protein n=1 Tax=Photobacterium kishitanii TaxID=318456 RepID=UPI0005D365EB|nr:methyl-accepting chemotaxis protein [Photobacterium kishitanii]KJG09307.1 chemotaxis protein [Photobacterium kishitanii]OBU28247.1 chemotaxis protein [Photobacterium kishitanii]OBU33101.1 chemotaxis protein [Photobacterium kishitanii]PSV05058.1 methyl-accepting chemotaxis protein [Photobacterium kishitanii]PSV24592.1 methyl-accepting chemotaxis protein [Photobacterium kishitanii]